MTPRTKAGAAHDAQVALVDAIEKRTWAATGGYMIPSGTPVNEAIRAFRRAIEDEMLDKVAAAVPGTPYRGSTYDWLTPQEGHSLGWDEAVAAVLAAIEDIRKEADR